MSIFYDVEQNTPEWQAPRLGIPTASAFDRIMTPKKREYSSQARSYMFHLLAEWISGEPQEGPTMPWMERGQAYEDEAVKCYEGLREVYSERGGFFTTDDGMAGCSPDRRVGADGLVEIKCPLLPRQVETAVVGAKDDAHVCQLQGQLWITGRKWVDVFSYHPALILDPRRIERDEDFIKALAANMRLFINDMLALREKLERDHPNLRAHLLAISQAATPQPADFGSLGVSDLDVDELFAARRREREAMNG